MYRARLTQFRSPISRDRRFDVITYPAIRGNLGITEYWVTTMKISDLVDMVQFPTQIPGWDARTLEEQFQRDLSMPRIKKHMVPYFARDEKRFSGALVVAAKSPDNVGEGKQLFESKDVISSTKIPNAYDKNTKDLGFIMFDGHKLIPLDGQHRIKAFQNALDENSALGDEKVAVIVVKFDDSMSRYIFNKINKYAKPTSKAGKLITDDDDPMAKTTRGLITDGVIPQRLVNIHSNSLNFGAHEFTLLSTFHDANIAIIKSLPIPTSGPIGKMEERERKSKQDEIKNEWDRLLLGIDKWKAAIEDPKETGDDYRRNLRKDSILGRPIGQLALVMGYCQACNRLTGVSDLDRDKFVRKLNNIDWNVTNRIWRGVLVNPNNSMKYGVRVAKKASLLIVHMIGIKLTPKEENDLLDYMYGATRSSNKKLPTPVRDFGPPKPPTDHVACPHCGMIGKYVVTKSWHYGKNLVNKNTCSCGKMFNLYTSPNGSLWTTPKAKK